MNYNKRLFLKNYLTLYQKRILAVKIALMPQWTLKSAYQIKTVQIQSKNLNLTKKKLKQ